MVLGLGVRRIDRIMPILKCFIRSCRTILTKFNHDSHLLERILEFIEEGRTVDTFGPHFEQEAHARMARVGVDIMFTDHLVVG